MLKTTVLPKVTISSAEVTRQRTEIALMSYDRNVHQIKIPTDLTAGEIAKILVIFTFPFDESVIQLNGAWVDGHIQFTLPEILRTQRGGFYIEVNIDLTDSQITFARYRAKVVKSDIDANASQATTVYFELFEDLVNEVADNAQQAKDVINLQNVDVEGHANTSKQTMDSDVNSVHDYSVSATTTIDAKVNTIEQAKTDAIQNIDDKVELVETTKKTALTGINEQVESVESAKGLAIDSINDEKTLAVNVVVQAGILAVGDVGAAQGSAIGAINGKVTNVDNAKKDAVTAIGEDVSAVSNLKTNALQSIADDTQSASDSLTTINGYQQTASDAVVAIEGHLANTTAKNELVDQKYSEFDSNVTTAGQSINEILALKDNADFKIKNEIVNGDFSKGLTGWLYDTSYIKNGRVEFVDTNVNGAAFFRSIAQPINANLNDVFYVYMHVINNAKITYNAFCIAPKIGNANYPTAVINFASIAPNTHISKVYKNTTVSSVGEAGFKFQLYGPNETGNTIIDNVLCINLTQTFGAGNEPTKEEMDRLIEMVPNQWWDGELNLTQQQYVNWLLSFISEKADKTQGAWITPTLLNGWAVVNGTPQYMKDSLGFVHFRGGVNGIGSTAPPVFKLPIGYRPGTIIYFSDIKANSFVRLDQDGTMAIDNEKGWMALTQISYLAEG